MHSEHDEPQKVMFFLFIYFFPIKIVKVSLELKDVDQKKKSKKKEKDEKRALSPYQTLNSFLDCRIWQENLFCMPSSS